MASNGRSASRKVTRVATSRQLAPAGSSRARVRRLVRQRRLLAVRRGVYAPTDLSAALTDHRSGHALHLAAAIAASGARVVGSHQSAAILHGLDLIGRQPADLVTV